MSTYELPLAALAALAAGLTNAVVGGGTLITFPTLLALGMAPVSASVTNTVALTPGYFGGAVAQRGALQTNPQRIVRLLVAATLGGVAGASLLLVTSNKTFKSVVPVLLLAATVLLALQPWLKKRLSARPKAVAGDQPWLVPAVAAAAVYGGFFGAGLGVMLLAVLGIALDGTLNDANAVKQLVSFATNLSAACFFVFSGRVWWAAAAVMAVAALLGGYVGGRVASRLNPDRFRVVVVLAGIVLTVIYAIKAI
jgi:uncharacterized protein